MKKSNILLIALAAVCSAFLLWLWYKLGFDKVDAPLDLVMSCAWWVVLLVVIGVIVKCEHVREEKVRTTYVAPSFLFNSEAGTVGLGDKGVVGAIEDIVANLQYGFEKHEIQEADKQRIAYVVRTQQYKAAQGEDAQPTWVGEVATVGEPNQAPRKFASRDELAALLA